MTLISYGELREREIQDELRRDRRRIRMADSGKKSYEPDPKPVKKPKKGKK